MNKYPRSTLSRFALWLARLCVAGAASVALAGEITLLAGAIGDPAAVDGPVAIARLNGPQGIAADRAGNIFFTDRHAVRKVSAAGEVTTVGGRADEWGSTDGASRDARFNNPQGLAVDVAGNVYVADRDNHAIRKITPAGLVSTLAGSASSMGSADGRGSAARFFLPSAVAVDVAGNVVVADTRNFTLRKISPTGVVTTIAGRADLKDDRALGYRDGPAAAARFGFIYGIAVGASGNVYVADNSTHVIRKLSTAGVVSTLAGQAGAVGSVDGSGPGARLFYPSGIAVDAGGNLFVADSHAGIVRRISASGAVTTIAGLADQHGNVDGPGSTARFNVLHGLALDAKGNVLVTDFAYPPGSSSTGSYVAPGPSGTIRRIDTAGMVTTVAGRGTGPQGSIDGAANTARFEEATGIARGPGGALYVTDVRAGTVRRISATGEVTTIAGKVTVAPFSQPTGIAVDGAGVVYVTDTVAGVVRRIGTDGVVTTLAGTAGIMMNARTTVDGTGAAARFHSPTGIAVDKHGIVYVSDGWDDVIRRVTPAGEVTTFAGKVAQRGSADGPIDAARFVVPGGLAVDASDNLYICDYGNRTIRKITPQGQVSTVAGTAGLMGTADGTGRAARMESPLAIVADELGNIYFTDTYTVRKITPAGVVTTIAGVPGQPGLKLGGTPGRLNVAGGVAMVDSNTLAITQGKAVVKIVLNAMPGAN